jgi:hypothetical protein
MCFTPFLTTAGNGHIFANFFALFIRNSIFHHKGEKELLRTRFFSVIFHSEGEARGVKNTEKKRDP